MSLHMSHLVSTASDTGWVRMDATGTELIHPQDLWATILEDSIMSLLTLRLCARDS